MSVRARTLTKWCKPTSGSECERGLGKRSEFCHAVVSNGYSWILLI